MITLPQFVVESNKIEGIERLPTGEELEAHERFLALPHIDVPDLQHFVRVVADAELRDKPGMDVIVGNHRPPPGGPDVELSLRALLVEPHRAPPWRLHVAYETLHPFMDGNGRSGRVLWAWCMQRRGQRPFDLPFLQRAYYQALDAARR